VDNLVRGEGLAGCRHGIGQRERGYPSGTGDVGQVKHAGRVGQGIVEVADDKRILVPRLVGDAVGSPLDGDLPAATGDAGEERHGEPPDAEYKGAEVRHAVLVARGAVDLVAEIRGSHVRCLREGHPRVEVPQLSREDFHEPRHEGEHAGPLALVQGTGGAAAVTFLPRPGGAFATAMAYFTFPVVRGHPVATGGFRSLAGRPRDFFLLFHNTSLLNVPVILQQCLKAP
jgi:hypothetical protein